MAELITHELGVHLNQRHEEYLQDVGIGYGGVKDLYLSPVEWWDGSPFNALRDDSSDDEDRKLAFLRGAALHAYVLDGKRLYERSYGVRPSRRTHPTALDTARELADACRDHGLSAKFALKAELVERLIRAKAPVEILSMLQAQFDRSGRKAVAPRDDDRIKLLHRMMMRTATELKLPDGSITIKDALEKSLTEVSIYWVDENGIRQRARFDWLKPNFTGDLKSITRWKKSNFEQELLREIILRGYMIQVAHYNEARVQLRKAVAEGRVFGGNKTQRKLLERIARSDYWAWVFLFAKMDGAAQVKAIVIRPDSDQVQKAAQQREEALANFLYHRDFHGGVEVPWFDPNVVWEPADTDWPMFSVLGQ